MPGTHILPVNPHNLETKVLLSPLGVGKENYLPKSTADEQKNLERDVTVDTQAKRDTLPQKCDVVYTLSLIRLKHVKGSQPKEPSLRKSLDC